MKLKNLSGAVKDAGIAAGGFIVMGLAFAAATVGFISMLEWVK